MFEHDLKHHVPDVPATVEDFFQQFVEVLQNDHAQRAVLAVVKLLERLEHELVRLAFDVLELVVLLFDFLQIHTVAKFKKQNDKLQHIEGEADKLMLESLQELYNGEYSSLRVVILKDL